MIRKNTLWRAPMVRNLVKLTSAVLLAGSIQAAHALNLSLDVEFTDSNYQVNAGDTFSDLLAAHNAANVISTTNVNALDGIDTSVYAGNISGDYSVLMMATLNIEQAGNYEFQVGTDWGRGGVLLCLTPQPTQSYKNRLRRQISGGPTIGIIPM